MWISPNICILSRICNHFGKGSHGWQEGSVCNKLATTCHFKGVTRFLDFANFYRQFIHSFSTIAAPMTSMLKKEKQCLVWTQAAISAFQDLKERFTTAPILHHPDPEREFIVEENVSSSGIGAVLSQRHGNPPKLYPCAFHSHKLTPTEQNYDVGNRELLAMKAIFKEWHHWLEGAKHPFTVLTDHRNLEYLKSAKRLNHRQARWSFFFTHFDFTETYLPGMQYTKTDALSRLHESSLLPLTNESIISPTIILAPIQWDIMTEITEAQATDPHQPKLHPTACMYHLRYVRELFNGYTLSSGHPGIAATVQLLTNHFWWSTLQADTITYIWNCSTCNVSKPSHQLPIPRRPWSHIAIDFTLSGGHTTILTGVSHYTDYLASTLSYTPCKVLFCYCWHFWAFSPKLVFLLTTWTVYSHLTICCLPIWPWLPFGYTLCLPPALTFALTLFMNLPCLCYSCYSWLNFACLTSSLK